MADQALVDAIITGAALVGGGLILGGAAAGATMGNGTAGEQLIAAVGRQPEAQSRLLTPFLTTVGIVEGTYFINLAFFAFLVFATPGK